MVWQASWNIWRPLAASSPANSNRSRGAVVLSGHPDGAVRCALMKHTKHAGVTRISRQPAARPAQAVGPSASVRRHAHAPECLPDLGRKLSSLRLLLQLSSCRLPKCSQAVQHASRVTFWDQWKRYCHIICHTGDCAVRSAQSNVLPIVARAPFGGFR